MSTSLRWGILGTGWIAQLQTADLLADGFTVAAVGSRSQEGADAFAKEFGIPVAHGSYEALVADPNVDVIYVATPHPLHAENAELAINAGKHVLVEKPFTLNQAEAKRIVALAAEKKVVVLEAMWTRWLPTMVRLREVIAAGTIGEIRTVIADHNQSLPRDPKHRINAIELGGGALLDLGIYPISFAWDMLGAPETVHAIAAKTATGVDRQTAVTLGYARGQQAVLHTALDTHGPNTASVIGTDGWIHIDTVFYNPTSFSVYDATNTLIERYEPVPSETRGMQYQARELERIVASGSLVGDILSLDETVGIMGTLDEVRRQIDLTYPGE